MTNPKINHLRRVISINTTVCQILRVPYLNPVLRWQKAQSLTREQYGKILATWFGPFKLCCVGLAGGICGIENGW